MPYYNDLYKTTLWEFDALIDTNIWETYEGNKNNLEKVLSTITGNNSSVFNSSESFNENSENNSNYRKDSSSNSHESGNNLSSDLPQANYAGVDYGTNLNEIVNDSNGSTNETGNNNDALSRDTSNKLDSKTTDSLNTENNTNRDNNETEKFTRHTAGLAGKFNPAELLQKYRESIINIDFMIISELKDLFMMIY